MKTFCNVSPIKVPLISREQLLERFQVGEIVECIVEMEAYIAPSLEVVPTEAKLSIKEKRSYPELKLYWWCMRWIEENTPEDLVKRFGIFSAKIWHEKIKSSYGITTVKYENLDQDDFHEYFVFAGKWIYERFGATVEDIIIVMSQYNLRRNEK